MEPGDPIAFFLTWVTYGTWLPGDSRGWVEYHRGWSLPSQSLESECRELMSEKAVRLNSIQRQAVEDQIALTCRHRDWYLHAVNCRTNHLHAVVTAPGAIPKNIRLTLKAYTTRCLMDLFPNQKKWWAERGSIRWVLNEHELESVVEYVLEGQGDAPP